MNLKSERLRFKDISIQDLEEIHRLHSVPEVDKFNTLGIPKNIEETRKIVQSDINNQSKSPRPGFCWKISLTDTGEFIGLAGMSLSNDRFKLGEFYYKFFPDYWGNGFATETAKRIIRVGFEVFKLHRIEAGVATKNSASIRVLEKAGMIREGIRRKILPIRGEWKDNYHYSILEDDFILNTVKSVE